MNLNRYSKLGVLLLVLAVSLATVAPAAAVASVDTDGVPEESEVGSDVSTTYTLTDLYAGDTPRQWTLQGQTNMTNATWSVTAYDNAGDQVGQSQSYGGDTFEYLVDADADVAELEVTVTGTTPEVETWSYDPEERFLVTEFTEVRDGGGESTIDSWDAHHYTSDSQNAREAIGDAETDVATAESNGADVTDAQSTLDNAIGFYENGDFERAVQNAEDAQSDAEDAQSNAEQRDLLLYGGVGVVALLMIVGIGFLLYTRQQGDDYDKLG